MLIVFFIVLWLFVVLFLGVFVVFFLSAAVAGFFADFFGPGFRVNITHAVHAVAVMELEVHVRSTRLAGVSDSGDLLPGFDVVAGFDHDPAWVFVAVDGAHFFAFDLVKDDDPSAESVDSLVSGIDDGAVGECVDGGS